MIGRRGDRPNHKRPRATTIELWMILLSINLLLLISRLAQAAATAGDTQTSSGVASSLLDISRCQRLNIPFCDGVKYNETTFPNLLNHQNQQEATQDINIYWPLLKVNCSQDIQMFLCSVFAPICFHDVDHIPSVRPCRSLCQSAKSGCEDLMKSFGFPWPEQLGCDKFPEYDPDRLCVGRNTNESSGHAGASGSGQSGGANQQSGTTYFGGAPSISSDGDRNLHISSQANLGRDLGFACPENFKTPPGYESHVIHLNGKSYKNCGIPCDGVLLNKEDTGFMRKLNAILALIAFISTSFTCVTFLLYKRRFEYPERPMIIISFCYLIVALCYLIGYFMGEELSCNEPFEPAKSITNIKMIRTITHGIKKKSCTLLFMALYFFETATSLWWLMLTISWFMSAGLRWVTEAIEGVSHVFHLIAWSVSALLTITVLALGEIEGDIMSGVCYVGLWNQDNLLLFVVLPKAICLVIGFLLLVSGFISLWNTRISLKEGGTPTGRLERLMVKIGGFSLLFLSPSVVLMLCYYHEFKNLNSWLLAWLLDICQSREYSIPCPKPMTPPIPPHYSYYLIKYSSSMFIGIFSCLLVMTHKTMISYRYLFQKTGQTHPLTSATAHTNHQMKSSHVPLQDGSGYGLKPAYAEPFRYGQ